MQRKEKRGKMIDYKLIDYTINQKWNEFIPREFDSETQEFIKMFIKEYYSKVNEGLIDYNTSENEKINMFKELMKMVKDKNSLLYKHLENNLIKNEHAENVIINDIFKLQECV